MKITRQLDLSDFEVRTLSPCVAPNHLSKYCSLSFPLLCLRRHSSAVPGISTRLCRHHHCLIQSVLASPKDTPIPPHLRPGQPLIHYLSLQTRPSWMFRISEILRDIGPFASGVFCASSLSSSLIHAEARVSTLPCLQLTNIPSHG